MSPLNLSKTPKQPSTPWACIPQLQWGNTTNRCIGQDFPFNRSVINAFMNHCANARKYKDPVTWLLPHHLAPLNLIPRIGVLFDRTFKNCVPLLMPYHVVPQTFGDNLTHFAYVWRAITMGKSVLEIVCSDCTTESVLSPHHKDPFRLFSHEEILCQKADSLPQRGAVDHMPPQYEGKGFQSPRKNGGWNIILDLHQLKVFIQKSKCCMVHGHWFQAMNNLIRQVTIRTQTIVKVCLSPLGHMVSCSYITPFARLNLSCLLARLLSVYSLDKDNMNNKVTIPAEVMTTLVWWTNLEQVSVGVHFLTHMLNATIITDTPLVGQRAQMVNHTAQCIWKTCCGGSGGSSPCSQQCNYLQSFSPAISR